MRMRIVLLELHVVLVFHNLINSSYTAPSHDVEVRKSRKSHTRWTSEMQNAFIEICRSVPSNETYYFDRVKEKWHELHPYYNVSDGTLSRKLYQIPKNITGRAKRTRRILEWDDEKTDELIDLYLNSRPYNKSHPVAIQKEWERRHPDYPKLTVGYLTDRARKYLTKRAQHAKGESSQRLFEWIDKQDSDLHHIYHVTLPEGQQQPIHMHKIWADLYPNYRELTYEQLAERVKYLQRRTPDEHFPWTKGQVKELLDIYQSTSPGVADQGQRIYDIWSKIHPKYSFMTPYYLQIHASKLVHHEETGINGKMYSKFTNEQETNLLDMYRRLAKPNKPLYDFHKAWVREFPAMAHLTANSLRVRVGRLIRKDEISDADATEGASHSGNNQSRHRKYHRYTQEERAHLLTTYRQTCPQEVRHGNRIHDQWVKENKGADVVQSTSLRKMIKKWIEEDSERKGKAPLVLPKTEEETKYSPNTSDSSK